MELLKFTNRSQQFKLEFELQLFYVRILLAQKQLLFLHERNSTQYNKRTAYRRGKDISSSLIFLSYRRAILGVSGHEHFGGRRQQAIACLRGFKNTYYHKILPGETIGSGCLFTAMGTGATTRTLGPLPSSFSSSWWHQHFLSQNKLMPSALTRNTLHLKGPLGYISYWSHMIPPPESINGIISFWANNKHQESMI